jgi:hypothetical protein
MHKSISQMKEFPKTGQPIVTEKYDPISQKRQVTVDIPINKVWKMIYVWYDCGKYRNLAFKTYDVGFARGYQERVEYVMGHSCWIVYN